MEILAKPAGTLFLVLAVCCVAYLERAHADAIVNDVTLLNPIYVHEVLAPKSVEEIVSAVRSHPGPISIGGGR